MGIIDRLFHHNKALAGRLVRCRRCGSLALFSQNGYWVFYTKPDILGKTCSGNCVFIGVSEKVALSSSGMSERQLLQTFYTMLCRTDEDDKDTKPLLDEVERRLGLKRPETEDLPHFKDQVTRTIDETVAILRDSCLAAVPIISKMRVEAEFQYVTRWGYEVLKEGTLQEICEMLQRNLERDVESGKVRDFAVSVDPKSFCALVYAGNIVTYRIWRTNDLFFIGA